MLRTRVNQLYKACEATINTKLARRRAFRDRLLIMMTMTIDLPVVQLLRLTRDAALDLLSTTKHPLTKLLVKSIQNNYAPGDYLFTSQKGGTIGRVQAWRRVSAVVERAFKKNGLGAFLTLREIGRDSKTLQPVTLLRSTVARRSYQTTQTPRSKHLRSEDIVRSIFRPQSNQVMQT